MTMNFSTIFHEYVAEPFDTYFEKPSSQGCFLVLMEMGISLIGSILNLIIVIPILEYEELATSTINVLMANLSLSNLVATTFVKLIGVVYHGYAVAAQRWDIKIPFCTIYTVTSRLSWAMFPFSIIAICGVGIAKRIIELLTFWEASKRRKKSTFRRISRISKTSHASNGSVGSKNKDSLEIIEDDEYEEEVEVDGFTKIQKGALGFVWVGSFIYACLTDKILSRVQTDEVICSMRESLSEKYNILSVLMVVAFPILCLVLWPISHLLLDMLSCLKGIVILSTRREVSLFDDEETNCCGDESDGCIETILVFGFTTIFLVVYPTSMLITEFYFAEIETMFPFMLIKYCLGSMPLVLSPACVLIIKRDIREAAKDIYMKRKVNTDDGADISLKDLVERLEQLRETDDDTMMSEAELRRILEMQGKA